MTSLRERISAAARELFLRDGPHGVSMRKVAEMAGVSAPAIYHHFESKDDLLGGIMVEGLHILEDYLRPALEAPTAFERLCLLVDRFLDFALEQPSYFDSAFLVPAQDDAPLPDELSRWSTFQLAAEQISQCMNEGVLEPQDPFMTVLMLWAEAHGLIMLFRMRRFGPDPDQFRLIYRQTIHRLLDGLKA